MPHRSDFKPGEFCWVDLNAHDLEGAVAWYGELFGWEHELMPSTHEGAPPYAFFKKGGAVAGGVGQMSDEMREMGIPPAWNCYVMTEDCAATEAEVRQSGGKVTVPTMEVPGHGKLAFFMDPAGASFAAWQSTQDDGNTMLVGEHGGMCWHELMTPNCAAAKDFYASLFSWQFSDMQMPGMGGNMIDYAMLKLGDQDAGGMMQLAGPQLENVPPHWMVYFAVDDCEAVSACAGETGGTVVVPPSPLPVGTFSVLSDPQGGHFSIISRNEPSC